MSSVLYSEEIIGRYFKTSLYSNLVNGSTGVLPWVYNDFEESLWHDVPLEKYMIEPYFGIVTVEGRLKPSGRELRDFAAFAKRAEIGKYRPKKAEAAILVPEGYYPHVNVCYKNIYTILQLAKGSGMDADLVWSSEDFSGYKLILIPTTLGMTTSAWDKVRRFVEEGGVIYHVYDGVHALNGRFNRLFGAEVQAEENDSGYMQMIAQRSWGVWNEGDKVTFVRKNSGFVLDVTPKEAEVLFSLEDGRPALLRSNYGKGAAFLSVLPMNDGLMDVPYREYLSSPSFRLISTMAEEAGIRRLAFVDSPVVETGCMMNSDTGEMMVICINHDKSAVDAELKLDAAQLPEKWWVYDFDTGEVVDLRGARVHIEAAGVAVYKIAPEKM